MSETRKYPQAVEETIATYDQIAANYAERNEHRHAHWGERMESFIDILAENDAERPLPEMGRPGDDATLEEYLQLVPVLDAGCGGGRDTRLLAAYDLPVLGVDLSQGMLDEAGERTARRLPKGYIRYALMDLRRLEIPDGGCRGVWCSASLLHVPRHVAPRAAGEIARVTRSGGPVAVFLKARTGDRPTEEMLDYEYLELPGVRRYYSYYTRDEAVALLEDAGLRVIDATELRTDRLPSASDWVTILARKP